MSHSTTTHAQPTPEEGVEPMGVNSIAMALWGIVSVAIVLGTMFVAIATTHEMDNYLNQSKVIEATNTAAKDAILAQQGILTSTTAEHISISEAKKLVLNELESQQ